MTRASLPPITVALDPGRAAPSLRRHLRRIADTFGMRPLEPVVAITRPFVPAEGIGLAAVREVVERAIPPYQWLSSEIDGFDSRLGGTVGLAIRPSAVLAETAGAVEAGLRNIAVPAGMPDERFVVPAVRGIDRRRFRAARERLGLVRSPWYRRFLGDSGISAFPPPLRPLDSIRLLLIAGGRIAGGYDLPARRWLSRPELGDRAMDAASLRAYRRARGLELTAPVGRPPGECWLLADLHLGHPGIALHATRPFPPADTGEMDRVLLRNWRCSVANEDRALFLGDLCAGPDPGPFRTTAAALTGRVTLVRGNHDPDLPELVRSVSFEANGHRFLGVHDPADAPEGFDGWVVHGHLHDSDLRRFPFFDPSARRVNVSAETAGYRPVPLSYICDLIASDAARILIRETVPTHAPRHIPS